MMALRNLAWFGLLLGAAFTGAQEPTVLTPSPGEAVPTTTLHVYTNLAQIPTLILSTSHERLRRVDTSKLRVSVDGGPLFEPTHVRAEGDDPIALAVLVDMTRPDSKLLPEVEDAVVGLGLGYLKPQDRISIYAMGCRLVRSANALPADSAELEHEVDLALEPMAYASTAKPCQPTMPLWDSLERVALDLAKQPGRRVLVAVTSGQDTGSAANWGHVGDLMMQHSIAVFGVLPEPGMAGLAPAPTPVQFSFPTEEKKHENPFNTICELSGGIESTANAKTLAAQLGRVMEMVRERYIIEFPRANDGVAGRHLIAVTLPGSDDYIRPSGISVPIMDRKALADPNTLPSNAATPQPGKRKPLPLGTPPPL